jgi:hypothetical protein
VFGFGGEEVVGMVDDRGRVALQTSVFCVDDEVVGSIRRLAVSQIPGDLPISLEELC